jgi:hypothetical protein
MKNVFELTDTELEDCFDGSTDVDMVRKILEKPGIVNEGLVDTDTFAQDFAESIQGFIDADEDSDEWQECWDNNFDWGNDIADSINSYLQEG